MKVEFKEYHKDLAATTAYIFAELMGNKLFFTNIDEATQLAEEFINKFPTGTNWEERENNWEEELFEFFCEKQNQGELNFKI